MKNFLKEIGLAAGLITGAMVGNAEAAKPKETMTPAPAENTEGVDFGSPEMQKASELHDIHMALVKVSETENSEINADIDTIFDPIVNEAIQQVINKKGALDERTVQSLKTGAHFSSLNSFIDEGLLPIWKEREQKLSQALQDIMQKNGGFLDTTGGDPVAFLIQTERSRMTREVLKIKLLKSERAKANHDKLLQQLVSGMEEQLERINSGL